MKITQTSMKGGNMRNENSKLAKIAQATSDFTAGLTNTGMYALQSAYLGASAEETATFEANKRNSVAYKLGSVALFAAPIASIAYAALK